MRVWSSPEQGCLPGVVTQEGISFLGLSACVDVQWIVSFFARRCFKIERRTNAGQAPKYIGSSRALSVSLLLVLSSLGAESFVFPSSLPHRTALSPLPSIALSLRGIRRASGLELVGRAEAAAGAPSMENEGRITAEILEVESVHSSQLNIAPPQFLTRVRLRLLAGSDTSGAPTPLTGGEGALLEAYTREQVDPNLIGKRIQCTLRYRGDERGGLYWVYEIRSLPDLS
jgi:hypothetical protein